MVLAIAPLVRGCATQLANCLGGRLLVQYSSALSKHGRFLWMDRRILCETKYLKVCENDKQKLPLLDSLDTRYSRLSQMPSQRWVWSYSHVKLQSVLALDIVLLALHIAIAPHGLRSAHVERTPSTVDSQVPYRLQHGGAPPCCNLYDYVR